MAKRKIKIENMIWETFNDDSCPNKCWCKGIRAKLNHKRIFIDVSWITKKQAELIVKIHNEWLLMKNL